jgi:PIN domain nuclease of toxin-antitoxin system
VKVLLDTNFVVWIVLGTGRRSSFPWLERYQPWGVSPVSLLEIQYLAEIGRIKIQNPKFTEKLVKDPRFVIDEIPLVPACRSARQTGTCGLIIL